MSMLATCRELWYLCSGNEESVQSFAFRGWKQRRQRSSGGVTAGMNTLSIYIHIYIYIYYARLLAFIIFCRLIIYLQVRLALGSDTGGSVRLPASWCGVVGFKPTYGLVSRYGLVSYASSMDCVGTMAETVSNCAALMDIIAGDERYISASHIFQLTHLIHATAYRR